MFYQLRDDHHIVPRAWNEGVEPPSSHYALLYPLQPGETVNALLLSRADSLPACMKDEPPQAEWAATAGFMERATVGLWKIQPPALRGEPWTMTSLCGSPSG